VIELESGRLIIVDDDIESLTPMCDLLSRYGYLVAGYTSGKDALMELKEQTFDLLLTDLVMPEMDGLSLLQDALTIDPSLIGIIITGMGTIQSAVDAMKVGAFDYMLKPLNYEMLRQILSRAISVRRLREAEKKYRSIFENAIGGIYQIAPNGRYITANLALSRILGYDSPEDLIMNLTDIERQLHVEPHRHREFIRHMRMNRVVQGFESQVYRKDGGKIWISENAIAVYGTNGKLLYYEGIVEDITERKKAEEELRRSREQLRNLSAHLQSAREKERMYMAREIHDELGQMLTALKMDLCWLNAKIPGDQKTLFTKTKSMSDLIDTAVKTVQRISAELRPGLLDDLGLAAAIEWQLGEFQKRTGIKCELTLDPDDIILSQDASTAIYRILQEALTNIVRHAHATLVRVCLREAADTIELEVADNGKGIIDEQLSSPQSFGLTGIRERVHLLQGRVRIVGINGNGTKINVNIPLNKGAEKNDKDLYC
jgi:two-component system sensor histidine kinase UhpB